MLLSIADLIAATTVSPSMAARMRMDATTASAVRNSPVVTPSSISDRQPAVPGLHLSYELDSQRRPVPRAVPCVEPQQADAVAVITEHVAQQFAQAEQVSRRSRLDHRERLVAVVGHDIGEGFGDEIGDRREVVADQPGEHPERVRDPAQGHAVQPVSQGDLTGSGDDLGPTLLGWLAAGGLARAGP